MSGLRPARRTPVTHHHDRKCFGEIPSKTGDTSPDQGIDLRVRKCHTTDWLTVSGSRLSSRRPVWTLSAGVGHHVTHRGCSGCRRRCRGDPRRLTSRSRPLLCDLSQPAHQASDLALDGIDMAHPVANGQIWEGVIRTPRMRSMPPQGMPRPDEAVLRSRWRRWLETEARIRGRGGGSRIRSVGSFAG